MNKLLNIESFPTLTHMEQHIHFILAASKKKEKEKEQTQCRLVYWENWVQSSVVWNVIGHLLTYKFKKTHLGLQRKLQWLTVGHEVRGKRESHPPLTLNYWLIKSQSSLSSVIVHVRNVLQMSTPDSPHQNK